MTMHYGRRSYKLGSGGNVIKGRCSAYIHCSLAGESLVRQKQIKSEILNFAKSMRREQVKGYRA